MRTCKILQRESVLASEPGSAGYVISDAVPQNRTNTVAGRTKCDPETAPAQARLVVVGAQGSQVRIYVRAEEDSLESRGSAGVKDGRDRPCSRQVASTKPRSQRCAGSESSRGCHICETVIASVRTGSGKLVSAARPDLA